MPPRKRNPSFPSSPSLRSDLNRRTLVGLGGLSLLGLVIPACVRVGGVAPDDDDSGTSLGDDDTSAGDDDTSADDDDTSAGDDDTSADDDDSGAGDDDECALTDDNIEGPFYVSDAPIRSNLDLYGDNGTGVTVSGRVLDANCAPISSAVLEVWHADPSGAYDKDSAEMRYRGQMATDAAGDYSFHSLVPGFYLNGPTYRPAHIHVKLWVGGAELLTTQLYFRDDPYNATDSFIEPGLIMDYSLDASGGRVASFDFVLAVP